VAKSRRRAKAPRGKSMYGCHQCGRIGTSKSIRVVDKRQTYGICWNRDACLDRRARRVGWQDRQASDEARRAQARLQPAEGAS